ncbi:hypothetical protein PG999_011805 [Apiospora kogelbergensis]|uniref:Cellobiose dehydrogenase cytochrome domain-containing protein n=1 Tax=Apiospora kogelbergensis TaxID=1337665 RepID=A0AAW0QGH3_9PEZI
MHITLIYFLMLLGIFHMAVVPIVAAIAQATTASTTRNTSVSTYDCWVRSDQWGVIFGWWDVGHQLDFYEPIGDKNQTTVTATVVTVVNTISNATSVTTMMPAGWVPPPTNAQGTQIQVITYYGSANATYSTTIPYPTVFIWWPEVYTHTQLYFCSGCHHVTHTGTIPAPTPQFKSGSEFNMERGTYGDTKSLKDPKGLLAQQATIAGPGGFPLEQFSFMFPDQPDLECHNFDSRVIRRNSDTLPDDEDVASARRVYIRLVAARLRGVVAKVEEGVDGQGSGG